jgi:protein-tyrosine phosphatase
MMRDVINYAVAMGFVDLHSHILPGLDDGPADLRGSLEVADGLLEIGFDVFCGTPHQRVGLYVPDLEEVRATAATFAQTLAQGAREAEVVAGAENCWDELLFDRSQKDEIPGYDGTKVFLVEAPGPFVPAEMDQQMFDWRRRGYLPVLAHVERYLATPEFKDRIAQLSQMAVMTCNLDAVAGAMGRKMAKMTRFLIQEGIAHALCTDIHGVVSLKPTAQGIRWVKRKLGAKGLRRLLDENPRKVLAGEHPD